MRLIPSWILVVLLAAAAWAAVFYQRPSTAPSVGRAAERSASSTSGAISFGTLHYSMENVGAEPVLVVQGTLINSGAAAAKVPAIEAVFYDSAHRPLERWIFRPEVRSLSPGQEAGFVVRRPHPPAKAINISVHFSAAARWLPAR